MKISVITVCYNSIATLQDTLESILRQTYPDVESIVVDGASKDGTVELIEKYSHQFSGRMKWLSEPDKGIYDAMNKGIGMATGDVIGFLNHKITVNIITNGKISEKKTLHLPKKLTDVIRCKNPRCITSIEQELPNVFLLTDAETATYRCMYCEEKYTK